MLRLEGHLKVNKDLIQSPNLAGKLEEDDLRRLGVWAWEGLQRDLGSREAWERRMEAAMDLALQLQKDKSFPWPQASNVAFPLVTIAALQFHSRSYPLTIPGEQIVRCRSWGTSDAQTHERAIRVGQYMSWQLLEEDEDWEEQHDRLLIQLPIVGCAFKKSYYSPRAGCNDSELVAAKDLVVDYYAKSIECARRKSHYLPMDRNEIYEKIESGVFQDVRDKAWFQAPAMTSEEDYRRAQREGREAPAPDETTPFRVWEQHCWIDLDGDGYEEPYILTFEESTQTVLRLVSRIEREEDVQRKANGRIIRITAWEYFTKYTLIPSPDGGIYDLGFGILLGPLNESTNSIINQLIDAGTLANMGGGFLGRGAKIKGGMLTFAPGQWRSVESSGDDLRKNLVPLPVQPPSQVLFQLLTLLIDYTERVFGSSDVMMGQNVGQNTPATTTQTMVEQGMKIYSTIFKRLWRSMKQEFRKLYNLNAIYLPDQVIFGNGMIARQDFQGDARQVTPVADPNITSESARLQQAVALKQAAMTTPGYDRDAVEMEFLHALRIESPERLFKGAANVPPLTNPKVQVEQMKMQAAQAQLQMKQHQFVIQMAEEHRLNTAKIIQMEAQAHQFMATANGVDVGHQIAAFEAAIGLVKEHNSHIRGLLAQAQKEMSNGSDAGGMGQMASGPGDEGGTPEGAIGGGGTPPAMG